MNAHKAIDVVLEEICLYHNEQLKKDKETDLDVLFLSTDLCDALKKKYSDFNYKRFDVELGRMTDRLFNDKHINRQGTPPNVYYNPTFDGILFCEDGGYQRELNDKNDRHKRIDILQENQKTNANAMTWLTIVLAVGTAIQSLYYFMDFVSRKDEFSKAIFPYVVTLVGALETTVALSIFLYLHLRKQRLKNP